LGARVRRHLPFMAIGTINIEIKKRPAHVAGLFLWNC